MKLVITLVLIFAGSSAVALENCFEIGHVCKAFSRSTKDYRGTGRLESSRFLAEESARRDCRRVLSTAFPTHPANYCDGDINIEVSCEEVSYESCVSVGHVCKAVHWNGGEFLGIGQMKVSRFLAEGSAIADCRKNHHHDLGYPRDYCESHGVFKCEEVKSDNREAAE